MLEITEPGYQDFRRDASLHRAPAEPDRRALRRVHADAAARGRRRAAAARWQKIKERRRARASTCCRSSNTMQTVDIDLIGNTMREPERERLSLILNELGTGLAGRGKRPQRGHPPRRPGAEGDRQGAGDPRPPEPELKELAVNSDTVARAAGPRARARGGRDPQLQRGGRGDGRAARRAGGGHPDAAAVPRRAAADDGAASARWPTSRRRCSPTCTPTPTTSTRRPAARAVLAGGDPGGRLARRGGQDRHARRSPTRAR